MRAPLYEHVLHSSRTSAHSVVPALRGMPLKSRFALCSCDAFCTCLLSLILIQCVLYSCVVPRIEETAPIGTLNPHKNMRSDRAIHAIKYTMLLSCHPIAPSGGLSVLVNSLRAPAAGPGPCRLLHDGEAALRQDVACPQPASTTPGCIRHYNDTPVNWAFIRRFRGVHNSNPFRKVK